MKEEIFAMAAFRSRQQVMYFEQALRKAGVRAAVMTTPRSVSVGCGLSVRFELSDAKAAAEVYRHVQPGNLIGFYQVHRDTSGQMNVSPLGVQSRYSG